MCFAPGTKITPLPDPMGEWDSVPLLSHPIWFNILDLGGGLKGTSKVKCHPDTKGIRRITMGEVVEVLSAPQGSGMNQMCLVQTKTGQGYVWTDMFRVSSTK